MTIAQWMVDAMIRLKDAGVPNGRTDALVLLSDLFDVDKSWVHSHPEYEFDDLQVRELESKLGKRLNRIPLAYIRGCIEFYGRMFTVNSHVLIPRPESESFIEILKDLQLETPRIADVGTGSGCLGITAALELPDASVDLYDIDPNALGVAQLNAGQYGLTIGVYNSDLLESLQSTYDVVLANLPYVPNKLVTSPEIGQEPKIALFSGEDGLDHYRKFWNDVSARYVLVESLESQHEAVTALAHESGYTLEKTNVLVQLFTR